MDKEALAMTNRDDLVAAAIRLRAAREAMDLSQEDVANAIDLSFSTVSNVERAKSFPSRKLMVYFFREHRIDFNFLIAGNYAQLPGDVLDRLWPALARVQAQTGLLRDSDRPQIALKLIAV